MNGIPVLNMKKIDALAKYLRLMIQFYSEALLGVEVPEPLIQLAFNGIIHWRCQSQRTIAEGRQCIGGLVYE